jgi:hypothetical protein
MMESREYPSGYTSPGRYCELIARPGLGLARLASACPVDCTSEIAVSVVICARRLALGENYLLSYSFVWIFLTSATYS